MLSESSHLEQGSEERHLLLNLTLLLFLEKHNTDINRLKLNFVDLKRAGV